MIENSDILLMSDDLREVVQDLEDVEDNFPNDVVHLVLALISESSSEPVAGRLVGLSLEEKEVKLDMRLSIAESYEITKEKQTSGLSCRMFYLYLGNDEIHFEGPYQVASVRMMDFDQQNKTCTLGLDLIRE